MRSRLNDLLGIDVPVVQAPMAGSAGAELAVVVSEAGGLGSLPCALLPADAIRAEVASIRARTAKPFSLNFFCHAEVEATDEQLAAWTKRLAPYYTEFGIPRRAGPLLRCRCSARPVLAITRSISSGGKAGSAPQSRSDPTGGP